MKEVYDFLKNCKVYYLATVEDGKPRVRPFGTVDIFEGRMYIQTGLKKDVAKQMLKNPHIEICALADDGKWLRLKAEVVLDESIGAQEHMLSGYPELRGMYSPGDGNNAVFYLKNATAQICSFTEAPKVITF